MASKCQHLFTEEEYKDMKQRWESKTEVQEKCLECDAKPPHLWACLQKCCFFVGCGKQAEDHIGQHCLRSKHHMSVCLKNFQVWCLACGTKLQDNEDTHRSSRTDIAEKEKMTVRVKSGVESGRSFVTDPDDIEMVHRPKGLCGLSNIGNSCYMNSAVQALSNCQPLTQFFLKCDGSMRPQETGKPNVALMYSKLVHDIWDKRRPKYVVPTAFSKAFKTVHSHFRGCGQQDSQEFLRCLMDRLHEELKKPVLHVPVQLDKSCSSDQGNHQRTKLLGGHSLSESMDVDLSHNEEVSVKERPLLEPDSVSADETGTDDDMSGTVDGSNRKKKTVQYHSIITDIFDGKLLSSVQCLTCNRVSNKVETFQDLSLPIPGKDDLAKIHAPGSPVVLCSASDPGWLTTIWDWMKSWFVGPQVTLQDCLAAFFASDELKGDNMYNCEKCKKLRNGVKYSRVQTLPEVLCIHLKRFRHEMYFSSKISSFVSFPTTGLDMKPFLTKDCPSRVTSYNLTAVITHFGNVGVGHYVAYAKNCVNEKWYEFSDSFVTEVPEYSIANAEAYVLFYSKKGLESHNFRNFINDRMHDTELEEEVEEVCYVSKEWFVRFDNCQEPGPITNGDILCLHGAIHPGNMDKVESLVVGIPNHVWEALLSRFGGGPEIQSLSECLLCKRLRERRQQELERFTKLHDEFQKETDPDIPANCLSIFWYKRWLAFVKGDEQDPPGPIDNSSIVEVVDGHVVRKQDSEDGLISTETWNYFVSVYGGGPAVKTGPPSRGEEIQEEAEEEVNK